MNNLTPSFFTRYCMEKKMKVRTYFYLTTIIQITFSGFLLTSCEDCYECDINRPEPYFNVVFINNSRLESVQDSIANLDTLLVAKRIELRELAPDAPPEEFDPIEFTIDSITIAKRNLDIKRRLIQSGSVFPDTVYSPIGKFSPSPDSATSFRFPLSMNQDSSTYYIYLGDRSDTLTVFYSRELVVENGSAVVRADSILPPPNIKTTFLDTIPNIQYNNDRRLTNETYLYLYF